MARKKSKKPKLEAKEKAAAASVDSDSDVDVKTEKILQLLKPYSKDQLVDFLCDAVVSDPSLLPSIRSAADRDICHRKIFVHGFGWDTTSELLLSLFEPYGEIEECNVVVDKVTGRAKGFGFILYKTRAAAVKALKQPQKRIKNRTAYCQLAAVGPISATPGAEVSARKIYVSNVQPSVDPDKLRTFFSRFGEIEVGPLGFDQTTGKSRGYALFIYKTQEGARKALEEPHKSFEGHQLHCQMASDSSQRLGTANVSAVTPQQVLPGPSALAAAAAAQNMALFTQNPSLNPAFSALMGNSATGLLPGNPLAATASSMNVDLGPYGAGLGGLMGNQSVLGPYGMQAQGAQSYQSAHLGQSSLGVANAGGPLQFVRYNAAGERTM